MQIGQHAAFPLSQYLTLHFTHFSSNLSVVVCMEKENIVLRCHKVKSWLSAPFFFLTLDRPPPLPRFSFFFWKTLECIKWKKKSCKCHFYFKNPVVFYSVAAKDDAGETQIEELQLKSMTRKVQSIYLCIFSSVCVL